MVRVSVNTEEFTAAIERARILSLPNWQPMLAMNRRARWWAELGQMERSQIREKFPSWTDRELESAKWEVV